MNRLTYLGFFNLQSLLLIKRKNLNYNYSAVEVGYSFGAVEVGYSFGAVGCFGSLA